MQQEMKENVDILDLTIESDEEEKSNHEMDEKIDLEIDKKIKHEIEEKSNYEMTASPLTDVLSSEDDSDSDNSNTSEEEWEQAIHEKNISYQNRKESNKQRSPSKSPKDTYQLLNKAVEEIRKGGSLLLTAQQYGIPENVLYDKLISRNLPDVTTLLSRADEENLVKWILRSNQCNSLVLKNHLLERVGKSKKVSRITPIFHKSKYGRLWYFHFLSTYPEIYENDGVLLKCDSNVERRRPIERNIKEITKDQSIQDENVSEKLISAFNIKKAVVILHDCKKQIQLQEYFNGKENVATQMKKNVSDNNSSTFNVDASRDVIEPRQTRSTGKDLSNTIFSKYKKKRYEVEKYNQKPFCKLCNRTFYDKYKLKRHLLVIHQGVDQQYPATCSECSKSFSSKYKCSIHNKLAHKSKLHKCSYCNQTFKYESILRMHFKRTHSTVESQITKFFCDLCSKSFNHKRSLKEHITYFHLKEKMKHTCNICGKSFIKLSNLQRHTKIHSKEKPFACVNCYKKFSRKDLLRKHLRRCGKKTLELECDRISKEYLKGICLD